MADVQPTEEDMAEAHRLYHHQPLRASVDILAEQVARTREARAEVGRLRTYLDTANHTANKYAATLEAQVARLTGAAKKACLEMGCFCPEDSFDQDCPMCALERAVKAAPLALPFVDCRLPGVHDRFPRQHPCGPTGHDMDCACGCSGDDTFCADTGFVEAVARLKRAATQRQQLGHHARCKAQPIDPIDYEHGCMGTCDCGYDDTKLALAALALAGIGEE